VEDAIDKFWSESNIKGRRVDMGCRSVCDDGQVLSRDLVQAANDSWWYEQHDLGISRSTRACRSTVLQSEKELGFKVERVTVKGAQRLCRIQPHYSTSALHTCQCVQPCYSAGYFCSSSVFY